MKRGNSWFERPLGRCLRLTIVTTPPLQHGHLSTAGLRDSVDGGAGTSVHTGRCNHPDGDRCSRLVRGERASMSQLVYRRASLACSTSVTPTVVGSSLRMTSSCC